MYLFACVAAMAMASCGNKTAPSADGLDTVAVDIETPAVADSLTSALAEELKDEATEPAKVKVTLATLQTKYAELVKSGKLEEAKAYASAVQEYINKNSEAIKQFANNDATISSLVDGIKALPTAANVTAEDALAAVKSDAQNIVSNAQAILGGAPEAVNNAAEQAVNDAKAQAEAKVQQKADEAKAAAKAKAQEKVDEAKAKANEAVNNALNDAANRLLKK